MVGHTLGLEIFEVLPMYICSCMWMCGQCHKCFGSDMYSSVKFEWLAFSLVCVHVALESLCRSFLGEN